MILHWQFNSLSTEQGSSLSADRKKNRQEMNSTFTFSTDSVEKGKCEKREVQYKTFQETYSFYK